MNKFNDVKVGDIIHLKPSKNYRNSDDMPIESAKVSKIGRKYFYAHGTDRPESSARKYRIETGAEYNDGANNYCATAYHKEQEILDIRERDYLSNTMSNAFTHNNKGEFTLDQLRRIKAIIDEPQETS
jgi:hypothetical protein